MTASQFWGLQGRYGRSHQPIRTSHPSFPRLAYYAITSTINEMAVGAHRPILPLNQEPLTTCLIELDCSISTPVPIAGGWIIAGSIRRIGFGGHRPHAWLWEHSDALWRHFWTNGFILQHTVIAGYDASLRSNVAREMPNVRAAPCPRQLVGRGEALPWRQKPAGRSAQRGRWGKLISARVVGCVPSGSKATGSVHAS